MIARCACRGLDRWAAGYARGWDMAMPSILHLRGLA
jgi:hypothetical protein